MPSAIGPLTHPPSLILHQTPAATDNRVFTAGADGSVRAWALGRAKDGAKDGELRELASRERAHDGRVAALAVAGSLVFSVSYDGRIKVRGCLLCLVFGGEEPVAVWLTGVVGRWRLLVACPVRVGNGPTDPALTKGVQ